MCRYCAAIGRTELAAQVDHIVPLSVDWQRRLDWSNLQSLCLACHIGPKARQERTGVLIGNTLAGEPADSDSAWFRR